MLYQDKSLYGISAVIAGLGAVVTDVGLRHEEYQAFLDYKEMHRHKWQLGGILGIGIGLSVVLRT